MMSAGSATQSLEPGEALPAHALGQDRHAATAHDPRDGHAAAAVVAGRGPDGALAGRVELAGHDARRQAAVGGDDLVRVRSSGSGRRGRRRWSPRRRSARAAGRGAPAPRPARRRPRPLYQWARKRLSGCGASGSTSARRATDGGGIARRIGQLREGGQHDIRAPEALHGPLVDRLIDHLALEAQPSHRLAFLRLLWPLTDSWTPDGPGRRGIPPLGPNGPRAWDLRHGPAAGPSSTIEADRRDR